MHAGELTKLVTLQVEVLDQDDAGQPENTWYTFAQCYAKIKPKIGKDFLEAQQLVNEITHDITIRFRRNIKPKMRVIWKDKTYEIAAPPINPEEKNIWLYLKCKEVVED